MAPSLHHAESPMSQNEESRYIRTHQYTPGTGRIHRVGYPDLKYEDFDNSKVEPVGPHTHPFKEGEFIGPGFFENVSPNLFVLPTSEKEWKYNMRREAQQILPFLTLGPWSCLTNKSWLRQEGFTLLLAIRDRRLAQARLVSGQKAADELGIEADSVDITNNQELISKLPHAIRRINGHISASSTPPDLNYQSPKKILLFCETGNGLSALVAVSYLMVMFNLELSHALHVIHTQRFCIDIDDLLKPLLVSFESILVAKRDVETARQASAASSSLAAPTMVISRKRSFADQVETETTNYDETMDIELPPAERKPLAPFQDRWA